LGGTHMVTCAVDSDSVVTALKITIYLSVLFSE